MKFQLPFVPGWLAARIVNSVLLCRAVFTLPHPCSFCSLRGTQQSAQQKDTNTWKRGKLTLIQIGLLLFSQLHFAEECSVTGNQNRLNHVLCSQFLYFSFKVFFAFTWPWGAVLNAQESLQHHWFLLFLPLILVTSLHGNCAVDWGTRDDVWLLSHRDENLLSVEIESHN